MVIPIPLGLGVTEDGRSLADFGQAARDALNAEGEASREGRRRAQQQHPDRRSNQ